MHFDVTNISLYRRRKSLNVLTCAVDPSSSFTSSRSSRNIGNDVDNSACMQSTRLLEINNNTCMTAIYVITYYSILFILPLSHLGLQHELSQYFMITLPAKTRRQFTKVIFQYLLS